MKMIDLKEFEQYISNEYLRYLEERNIYDDLGIDPPPEIAVHIENALNELLSVGKWIAFYYLDNNC